MRTEHVVVVEYDAQWQQDFADIAKEIRTLLHDETLRIEHVGSTSIPGLAAKPIIDMDVVIASMADFESLKQRLEYHGYQHEGDLGIVGREAFCYEGKHHLQMHHLYVCPSDSRELYRHITFRDYMKLHPDDVQRYSQIKQVAATQFPYDIDAYCEMKGPVIEAIYRSCRLMK